MFTGFKGKEEEEIKIEIETKIGRQIKCCKLYNVMVFIGFIKTDNTNDQTDKFVAIKFVSNIHTLWRIEVNNKM